ncbi:hypothetical protein EHS89_16075 [Amphritea balenae]|uniref:RanBP2-type domain-containing protein n=1 Tax=Amphritea balenae TaxID=452629 RepID=A0A3P1SKW2_9GAMM|nr:hypothetical protein [Amphritea balenae]RRC97697.1 hypothetical protein EHS89_16075 [Amphritea balenae]
MPDFKWSCKFCSYVNLPGIDKCSECGLSAYASAEDIELHAIPGAYEKNKTIKKYQDAIVPFIFLPGLVATYIVKGQLEILAVVMLLLIVLLYRNSAFLAHAMKYKWVLVTFCLWFLSLFILMYIRREYVPIWGDGAGYIALLSVLVNAYGFLYLFKSKRGKELYSAYYETANK